MTDVWTGAVQARPLASRPVTPSAAPETFQFFLDTDSGDLTYWDGSAWLRLQESRTQAAPAAKTGDATLTAAELLGGIVTSTSATAVALTLPLGSLMDAAISGGNAPVDYSFDWSIINLGSSSGAVTVTPAASGHTYVGSATLAISTSHMFRTRKTADDTFVTYRIS
jgi:hypothetical protein